MRYLITILSLVFINTRKSQSSLVMMDKSLHTGLTEKIGNFSVELLYYSARSQPTGRNMIISPVTVWTVLAVIAEGAIDDTLFQICSSLRISLRRRAKIKEEYEKIIRWLQVNTTTVELQKVNALFVDEEKQLLEDFKSSAKGYDTSIIGVDFTNTIKTSNVINTAISTVTKGRIPSVIDSSTLENANLILISALYFRGWWTVPFKSSSTKMEEFYDSEGKSLGFVNMMSNTNKVYTFAAINSLQANVLQLPYGENKHFSMLILLPKPGVTLHQMFYNFANVTLDTVFEELESSKEDYAGTDVEVSIPRFKIETNLDLTDSLKSMGIKDLFDQSKSRLPYMTMMSVYVSKIIHKAEIEVTEEGTIASAVTVAQFADRIGSVPFKANRPFCFFIIERVTNSIVFGGTYHTPSLY